MRLSSLLLIAVLLSVSIGCGKGRSTDLVGDWEGHIVDEATGLSTGVEFVSKLTFHEDGSFEEHTETKVMMTLRRDTKGTYRVQGQKVSLEGSSETFMDDGYRKETNTEPFKAELTFSGDTLRGAAAVGPGFVYTRAGTKLPKPAGPQKTAQEKPDPAVDALIAKVEAAYAKLSRYADEGTMRSNGDGFMATEARFQTRFERPKKFLFKAEQLSDGKPYETSAVWSDGSRSWLYDGRSGGSAERSIGNGLSILSVPFGSASSFVPDLLMAEDTGTSSLRRIVGQGRIGKEEQVNSRNCYVITQSGPDGGTVWVDKSSFLILKARDAHGDATITYKPRANPKINNSEFDFQPPN